MECPACLECTIDRVVPCGHSLCEACADKWMERGHTTCPMCRAPMVSITSKEHIYVGRNTIRISFDSSPYHMGVTLTASAVRDGVRVRALNRRDLAYRSGLRTGDVITHINSMAIVDHRAAVDIIDIARSSNIPLYLNVRRPWRFTFLRRFEHLVVF